LVIIYIKGPHNKYSLLPLQLSFFYDSKITLELISTVRLKMRKLLGKMQVEGKWTWKWGISKHLQFCYAWSCLSGWSWGWNASI